MVGTRSVRWAAGVLITACVLAGGVLSGCADPESLPGTPPPVTPGASGGEPTPEPTPTPGRETRAVPVYYVADTSAGLLLQREFHRIETADPVSDAVREMFAEPTGLDPDYRTLWPAGTQLRVPVTTAGGVITVDLTGLDPTGASVGTQGAELSVQQLVFTVQGALQSTDPVRILLDGAPIEELFGAVPTAEPVARADPFSVRSLVQISAPAQGDTVGRQVAVSGEAAVFEATVLWEVLSGGEVVQSGFTSTAQGQTFAPFEFTVDLEPGDYVVRIMEDDPSGGEGRPVLVDDKAFTVA